MKRKPEAKRSCAAVSTGAENAGTRRTYENRDELEAVHSLSILLDAWLALQDKADLDDASQPHGHEGEAKHFVGHSADHEGLRVRRHGPAGDGDHEAGDEVALRRPIPGPTEPDTRQPGAPPDDAHGGVLPVVPHPRGAPVMLGESVDAAPGSNDNAVKELLAPTGPDQPHLSNQQQNQQQDSVRNEGATHDEVCRTLAEMISLAEPERRDASKKHLYPSDKRERFAVEAMQEPKDGADTALEAPLEMELEVGTEDDLCDHEEEHNGAELGVHIPRDEFPSAMFVP